MTIDRTSVGVWLGEAHNWLRAFDDVRLHRSLQTLIEQMQTALEKRDYNKANSLIEQLKELSNKLQLGGPSETNERSVILAECAFAAYKMGYGDDALKLLKTSLETCNRSDGGHFEATATWMLGCLQLEDDINNAIASWENSIGTYERLKFARSSYLSNATFEWYANRIAFMTSALNSVLGRPDPTTSPKNSNPASPTSTPGFKYSQDRTSFYSNEDVLRLFAISSEVHAGDFHSTNGNGNSIGFVEVDQVQINGSPYRIVNLRDSGRVIRYTQGRDYEVTKVKGDSMNAEGIDPDDYVLLRLQDTAENNDFVAAVIQGFDTEATLKKFIKRANKAILQFRSTNPEHKDAHGRDKQFVFDLQTDGFAIVGVVIAVFKPV